MIVILHSVLLTEVGLADLELWLPSKEKAPCNFTVIRPYAPCPYDTPKYFLIPMYYFVSRLPQRKKNCATHHANLPVLILCPTLRPYYLFNAIFKKSFSKHLPKSQPYQFLYLSLRSSSMICLYLVPRMAVCLFARIGAYFGLATSVLCLKYTCVVAKTGQRLIHGRVLARTEREPWLSKILGWHDTMRCDAMRRSTRLISSKLSLS